ncbi:protein FAM162B-like [Bufo gargarizans]|uniref:protein FAM162B-like n=1 Tax=Bufo gargarizans TaxID=30331 RepID=UPI001CF4E8CA|nr:protein FAM162B-like [Bufo gargarizans]
MSRLISVSLRSLVRGVCAPRTNARDNLHTRSYCQNANPAKPSVTKNQDYAGHYLYRNERRPTDFDKKVLVWSGRFKKQEEIPEFVSWEVISAARSNIRIKICTGMIIFTIVGCIFMVRSGKKALKEDKTLLHMNIEKKAKWREDAAQDQSSSFKSH